MPADPPADLYASVYGEHSSSRAELIPQPPSITPFLALKPSPKKLQVSRGPDAARGKLHRNCLPAASPRNRLPHMRHRHDFGWSPREPWRPDSAKVFGMADGLWGRQRTDISHNLRLLDTMGYAVGTTMRETTWRAPVEAAPPPKKTLAGRGAPAGQGDHYRGLIAGGHGACDGGLVPKTESYTSLPPLAAAAAESHEQESKRLKVRCRRRVVHLRLAGRSLCVFSLCRTAPSHRGTCV